jgi:hypothetical protein
MDEPQLDGNTFVPIDWAKHVRIANPVTSDEPFDADGNPVPGYQNTGVEQALTWAQQIADLQVENAALREENAKLLADKAPCDITAKALAALSAAENALFSTVTTPAVIGSAIDTFPLNALKHSR